MHNRWTFHPAGEAACDVEFFITYEFKSRALAMLMGAMFDAAFRRFAVAFEQRADAVYGRRRHEKNGPADDTRRATKVGTDQVRVRMRIMKLSNPSSATCSQAKELARYGTRLS